LLVVVALHYNDLVFLRRRADRDWSNIEVALKKRKNLIPRLQVIVKQYMSHESKLQQHLVKLRDANQRMLSQPDGAARYFRYESAVLASVQVRVEQYPELQAESMVGDMMDKIAALETEIAFLREGYNNSVTEYNVRVETFPDLFLARAFKFERQSRFAI
jgi:LemA protein